MSQAQLLERSFHLRTGRERSHSPVVKIIIIAQALSLLQVGPRLFGRLLGRDDVAIVCDAIRQVPPFEMETAFVSFLASRRMIENLINLCAFEIRRFRRSPRDARHGHWRWRGVARSQVRISCDLSDGKNAAEKNRSGDETDTHLFQTSVL